MPVWRMAKAYRAYLPEQDLLLPPSLRDWLPENHLAHFVSDVVDQLDLTAIESVYEKEERGQPPYHPRMMTKILLYGYCVGVFSSRRIQKKLVEDVGFRMLAAGNEPDFRTISDFRKLHLSALQGLFAHPDSGCNQCSDSDSSPFTMRFNRFPESLYVIRTTLFPGSFMSTRLAAPVRPTE